MLLNRPQAIRTIFFDVGFTLIHPYPSILEICQRVCARLNLHIHVDEMQARLMEAEDFYRCHMRVNRHVWASESSIRAFWLSYYKRMLRPFLEEHDEELLHRLAVEICREFELHTSWRLYPDVIPTLQALQISRRYTLGAISDWGISLGSLLQRLRLNTYFDCLLTSATLGHSKPNPALYEAALERADTIADYTLHIGDSYTLDVLGARAVGMTPLLLDRKHHLEQRQVDCLLIYSLKDILSLLEVEHDQREVP